MAEDKEKKAADKAAKGKEAKEAKPKAAAKESKAAKGKESTPKAAGKETAAKKAEGKESKAKESARTTSSSSTSKAKEPVAKKAPGKKDGEAQAAKTPTAARTKEKLADEADDTAAKQTGVDKKAAESSKKQPATKPRRRDAKEAPRAVVVRAQAKYVRSSARKARLVCDQIRGKSVPEARALLAFSPRGVAEAWTKLLESAVANAENNHELEGDELRVIAVYADEGPTIKRFRPRAMGRASRIRKRTSHLTIQLAPISVPTTSTKGGKS